MIGRADSGGDPGLPAEHSFAQPCGGGDPPAVLGELCQADHRGGRWTLGDNSGDGSHSDGGPPAVILRRWLRRADPSGDLGPSASCLRTACPSGGLGPSIICMRVAPHGGGGPPAVLHASRV